MKFIAIFTLLFSSVIFAQEVPQQIPEGPLHVIVVPPPPDLALQAKMDKIAKKAGDQREHLQRLVWKWQKKLHLDPWVLGVTNATLEEFPKDTVGFSTYDSKTLTGTILVLSAEEYLRLPGKEVPKTLKAIEKDQENTVVHELIHLWMRYADHGQEEMAVHFITGTILNEK